MSEEFSEQVSRGARYVVYDRFLPADGFAAARQSFQETSLRPGFSSIEPIFDGLAFRGGDVKYRSLEAIQDPVAAAIQETLVAESPLLGMSRADFEFTQTAWSYPAGSRLSWHRDGGEGRLGAYVYFVHEEWNPGWGGELMLLDEQGEGAASTAVMLSRDVPRLVLPKPNRLVIFRAGTPHAVQRVDPAAGDRARRTFTGFVSVEV